MKNLYLPAICILLFTTGCANSGAFLAANQTIVNLNEGNYTVTETNITGESQAAYVLGVSYSTGLTATTLAIARVEGSGSLYAEALQDLWNNYESVQGEVADRRIALANIRYDSDILNLIFYTKVKVTVRADVIEFD